MRSVAATDFTASDGTRDARETVADIVMLKGFYGRILREYFAEKGGVTHAMSHAYHIF